MSAFVPVLIGAAVDRLDERDTLNVAEEIAAALGRLGYASEIVTVGLDMTQLARLSGRSPRAVFNLVESLYGDAALGHMACSVLEHLGIAFTGASAQSYVESTSKLLSKVRFAAEGIPTPGWWRSGCAVPPGMKVIIKSVQEHGSVGMDAGSVVCAANAAAEIDQRQKRFGGAFFAEAYLEGREFNIAILERGGAPAVLPLAEMMFDGYAGDRPRIMDYSAKWDASDFAYQRSQARFGLEESEPELAARLTALAARCWEAFGLAGYARVDIRLADDGEPLVLEVNANPCLAGDAGFFNAARRAGLSYDDMVAEILRAALRPEPARH